MMSHVEHPQSVLPLVRDVAAAFTVPIEMVWGLRTQGQALDLAIRASGLEQKEVYMALGIDPGTFSKILSDKATFPLDRLRSLCTILKNRIFLDWINYQVGCMAVVIQSDAERELAAERERTKNLAQQVDFLTNILQGRKA